MGSLSSQVELSGGGGSGGGGGVDQIWFSKRVSLHKLKTFEVKNDLKGNSFVIRNGKRIFSIYYYENQITVFNLFPSLDRILL